MFATGLWVNIHSRATVRQALGITPRRRADPYAVVAWGSGGKNPEVAGLASFK